MIKCKYLVLLLKALQLQGSLDLLNKCFPFRLIFDVAFPICQLHPDQVALNVILTSVFLAFQSILSWRVTTQIFFSPCCCPAYDWHDQTGLTFAPWYSLWCFCYQSIFLTLHSFWSAMCRPSLWQGQNGNIRKIIYVR